LLEGQAPLGFPKVLDVGQCNDISGAIAVASALASHYKCSVNQLPLSFAVSWLEQKAVAQLLTCLSLGIQGIKYVAIFFIFLMMIKVFWLDLVLLCRRGFRLRFSTFS
jgi:hydroxylamine reductase (hybrid-cluster protein)